MKVVIRFTAKEELQALPILLRHSPGTVLPNRTYLVSEEAAKALREAGVTFTEVSREAETGGGSAELDGCLTPAAFRCGRGNAPPFFPAMGCRSW